VKELCSLKNHSPVTLHYSPAISNINENPAKDEMLVALATILVAISSLGSCF